MFSYYLYKGKYLFSLKGEYDLVEVAAEEANKNADRLYFLNAFNPLLSRKSFLINHPGQLFIEKESIGLIFLDATSPYDNIPNWIIDKIHKNKIISINTNYPNWENVLDEKVGGKWKVNILAMGDVGSTLLIGLRLLGAGYIERIGIYDRKADNLKRWEQEANQIVKPFSKGELPPVSILDKNQLFDCNMFLFCASKGVPAVGTSIDDVRMAQFEPNAEIIKTYAIMARDTNYKGFFGVVSDPVDLLCKVVFLESNKYKKNNFDFKGIASNRIIGYGLGVMNGRASYYAKQAGNTIHYIDEGRVFGPHGEGLIVANSIKNYDDSISKYLTNKTINANKEIRALGFKPYIAPSLSSGALSIMATIKGEWFYGSTYMGGAFMGSKCRLHKNQIELEQLDMPGKLSTRIKNTHARLMKLI